MAETQIQILSDLHLESPEAYDIFEIEPKAPYLALLGDIGCVKDDGFFDFLRKQLDVFRVVFLVLGNHEPYCSRWPETMARIEQFKGEINAPDRFILLNRTRYDISPTVTILGCTLFSRVLPEQQDSVGKCLNDFYYIYNWSVAAHSEAHDADLEWLNHEVESIARLEPERKIVVFTHYCPMTSDEVTDPQHRGSNISSGFRTDLSNETCWKEKAVKLWAFGHTHYNCDFVDEHGKRVLANQRGYYFAQAAGFDGSRVVEL